MKYCYRAFAGLILASLVMGCTALGAGFQQHDGLKKTVKLARTKHIHPHASLPSWFDWERTHRGLFFLKTRRDDFMSIIGTTSLISTFACKDITPVLMHTQRLPKDFVQR